MDGRLLAFGAAALAAGIGATRARRAGSASMLSRRRRLALDPYKSALIDRILRRAPNLDDMSWCEAEDLLWTLNLTELKRVDARVKGTFSTSVRP